MGIRFGYYNIKKTDKKTWEVPACQALSYLYNQIIDTIDSKIQILCVNGYIFSRLASLKSKKKLAEYGKLLKTRQKRLFVYGGYTNFSEHILRCEKVFDNMGLDYTNKLICDENTATKLINYSKTRVSFISNHGLKVKNIPLTYSIIDGPEIITRSTSILFFILPKDSITFSIKNLP